MSLIIPLMTTAAPTNGRMSLIFSQTVSTLWGAIKIYFLASLYWLISLPFLL